LLDREDLIVTQDIADAQRPAHTPPAAPLLADFEPLRRAERILLHAFRTGEIAKAGFRRPLVPSADFTIRGAFVSFLARGGDSRRGEGRSLQLLGAWIEGRIDLRDAVVPESLWFYRCVLDATPRFDGARIGGSVSFPDCLLPGLRAEACAFAEDLVLNSGCTVRSEVRLAGATIGGDLNCERMRLRSSERSTSPSRRRLVAHGARIGGDVILDGGFEADGDVELVGARIAGNLRAGNARLSGNIDSDGMRGDALNLDRVRVAGRVSLGDGFSAAGLVRLTRARIDGDLDCSGAAFDVFGDVAWGGCATLLLDRSKVGGTLMLARLKHPLLGASFIGARVGALVDDVSTWGERLALDGFAYARFAAGAPTDARFRLAWLARQEPAHLRKDFRPGPWRQLIAVLRRTGHNHEARVVAVQRESHLRRIGRVGAGAPRALRWLPRLGHWLFGLLVGYGYRPLRLVAVMAMIWLACAAMYQAAAERGVMAPTNPAIFNDPRYARCRADAVAPRMARNGVPAAGNWTRCADLPVEYPAFRPYAYSLDLLLPLVDLQQEHAWAAASLAADPVPGDEARTIDLWRIATRTLSWFEILFGWAASLTLAAALTGLFDRDRYRSR
jgi:hypothetical protein